MPGSKYEVVIELTGLSGHLRDVLLKGLEATARSLTFEARRIEEDLAHYPEQCSARRDMEGWRKAAESVSGSISAQCSESRKT